MTTTIFHLNPRPKQGSAAACARPSRDRPARALGYRAVLQQMALAWRRHRSRASIAELSDAMLKDIGVTRAEADYEANRPFWRV